jgi:hypothetical protein
MDTHSRTNPKSVAGRKKPSTHAIPPKAWLLVGEVMRHGAEKYDGPFGWRDTDVDPLVYFDAMQRHLLAWREGKWTDPESGLPHLAHVIGSCLVLLDSEMASGHDIRYPGAVLAALSGEDTTDE